MAQVELECTTCGTPLRIETFTGAQIVVEEWYIGVGRYNSTEDLCSKCYKKEIESLWSYQKPQTCNIRSDDPMIQFMLMYR